MIRRFYIHNFRCLENFELPIAGQPSLLLIGKNGAGKTTVGLALELLQKIARGTNRVGELIKAKDITRRQTNIPVRFEIEVHLKEQVFQYSLAFELPEGFRELRVFQEKLTVDSKNVYTRELAQVRLARPGREADATFSIDWHLVALPIIQDRSVNGPLDVFRSWLAGALVLRPIPSLIGGDSEDEVLQPRVDVTNFGAWFSGLLASAPSAYGKIAEYLREVMPDLRDIKNPPSGKDTRTLLILFSTKQSNLELAFDDLSDGEKCFMICALVIAANDVNGPLLCFWDEPDNYLAPSEIGASIVALRRSFETRGQLIVTSHSPESIRRFADENTLILYRHSHIEPTIARAVSEVRSSGAFSGDLVDAIVRGDVDA